MNKTKSRIYESSPSRIDPSTIAKQQFQVQIQQMRKQTFKPFNITKCQTHLLPKQLICISQNCPSSNQLFCNECNHCSHPTVSINKIIPLTCQWLFEQNSQIQTQNKKLIDEWNIVSQNITYCIEIFQELLKIIENYLYKKIYAPKKFIDITNMVHGMWTKDSLNQSPEMVMKMCNQLQKKYKLFDLSKDKQILKDKSQKAQKKQRQKDNNNLTWQHINCQDLEHEKKQRLFQALNANKKSKQFSENALAFSQSLAELIESKIKEQEHKIKIKQIKIKNQLCLKDLISKFGKSSSGQEEQNSKLQEMLQNVETFTMEVSGKESSLTLGSENSLQDELSQIGRLKNLKELKINNKNGKIHHKMWYNILNYVEMLKFLKDLKLVITQKDLPLLASLFKEKEKAVRQIQSLTLQITDQKDLDLNKLNEFLNTLQLRRLHLNLSRNGLEFKKVHEFIRKLKIYTSLSQLPLIECKIILTANKIHPDQKIQLQSLFKQVCKDVKINQLTL